MTNTTLDDFPPESIILDYICLVIDTNGRNITIKSNACCVPLSSFGVILLRPDSCLFFLRTSDTLVRHKTDDIGFRVILVRRTIYKHFKKMRSLTIFFGLEDKVYLLRQISFPRE